MSTVNVWVVSADTRSERRIDPHISVEQLKNKLELITGVPVANQAISILSSLEDRSVVATLDDNLRPVGYYGLRDWHVLKVDDTNPSTSWTGQLTDVTQTDKFELSQEEYANRTDTVLAYKQKNKVGRFAPKSETEEVATAQVDIPIGSRCEVESTEPGLSKRGRVQFVGPTKFGTGGGVWVGVEYDEPMGKNDGSVNGERYFTCRPNFGAFVRPNKIKVGDYPVEELDLDEEEI
ncbi:CAP-Gly domain-containing protein [Mycena indigotica]|uniref:CAP-Gly domain-containing protein n=1 Tax=Mycena indigotica TaxID=2126181 RepID=A0A8H6T0N9_9AGAR|nr:CAP-Gly domain-containing protein [Mycena indigotica]KAF7309538.1 CAP-Gly domain-containing protein [Mycena indigotica]